MTEYAILKAKHATDEYSGESEEWFYMETRSARSTRSAIAGYLGSGEDSGTFVAVPVRSWKPVTVKVTHKTALEFS